MTTFFGPVTIGTDVPAAGALLHISDTSTGAVDAILLENTTGPARINLQNLAQTDTATTDRKWTINSNGDLRFTAGADAPEMRLDAGGTLTVQNSIKVGGTTLNVPDFVFAPDYQLTPLQELKAYIDEHRHLPSIPSAEEVSQHGLNMTEVQLGLIQTVEELTLYIFQQQEKMAISEFPN